MKSTELNVTVVFTVVDIIQSLENEVERMGKGLKIRFALGLGFKINQML